MNGCEVRRNVTVNMQERDIPKAGLRWLRLAQAKIDGALEIFAGDPPLGAEIDCSDTRINRIEVKADDVDRLHAKKVTLNLLGSKIGSVPNLHRDCLMSLLQLQPPTRFQGNGSNEGPDKRAVTGKAKYFAQGPWTNFVQVLREQGDMEDAKRLDIERQKRVARSADRFRTRLLGWWSGVLFQFGHGWDRAALAMVAVTFLSVLALGPALAVAGSVRPVASLHETDRDPIVQGLRFSLYGTLPVNVGADRKDWDLDGWGEAAFVYLRLLGWMGAGAAGVAIGLRVRRWE